MGESSLSHCVAPVGLAVVGGVAAADALLVFSPAGVLIAGTPSDGCSLCAASICAPTCEHVETKLLKGKGELAVRKEEIGRI